MAAQVSETNQKSEEEKNLTTENVKDEITQLSEEFSTFLNIDTSKQMAETEDLIDGILAKLEEFCTVIEMIRSESKDVIFTTLPVLHQRCQDLQPIFKKIDQLQDFMSVVKSCVEDNEEKVKIAEKELASKNIKKILKSVPVPKFFMKKKEVQQYLKENITAADYQPPKTFSTSDYFPPHLNNFAVMDDSDDISDKSESIPDAP